MTDSQNCCKQDIREQDKHTKEHDNVITIKLSLDGYDELVVDLDKAATTIGDFVDRIGQAIDKVIPIAERLSEVLKQFSWIFDKEEENKEEK